jgi:hypothetical protein
LPAQFSNAFPHSSYAHTHYRIRAVLRAHSVAAIADF